MKVANSDMQSKTSLIEARLITGDEALFKKFQKTLVAKCVAGYEDEYIAMRLDDQAARRAKFGNSACMQEPNLKNGCGGLRDFQNLLWMTFFKYRTRSLKELQPHEFVSEAERKQLEAAYDFLLRVRTEMHYHTNRAMDVLSKNLQPAIAHNLGYRERSPSKRIEEFMRDVYTAFAQHFPHHAHARAAPGAAAAAAASWRPVAARAGSPASAPAAQAVRTGGRLQVHQRRNPRHLQPRLPRPAAPADARVSVRPAARAAAASRTSPSSSATSSRWLDREFLTDEHVRETFLTILNQRGNVAPILRAMHEVDLLGKYLPEFGKLTCLVQHEFYHQYTADEHTLMCLEQLDRIWEAKAPPYTTYTPLFQKLERPFLLYLALLLHDVGKAAGPRQPFRGERDLAVRVAKRLHLDGSATQTLPRRHRASSAHGQRLPAARPG